MLRRKLAAERYVPKWAWLLMAGVAGGGGGKEEEGKEGREMRVKGWRGRGRRRGSEVFCGAGILLFCCVSLRFIYLFILFFVVYPCASVYFFFFLSADASASSYPYLFFLFFLPISPFSPLAAAFG